MTLLPLEVATMKRINKLDKAEHHHTDLNIFGAIVAILEGGCIYTTSGSRTAHRIIDLCKKEQDTQLRLYDHAARENQ
jgi:hypothetical protein